MTKPRIPILTLALVLGIVPILAGSSRPVLAADPKATIDAGKALFAEGDALADAGKTTEAILKYKEAIERLLPVMRKIPFTSTVKDDVTPREKLKDFLLEELDREMPPEKFRASELGMKALGFIPRETDLRGMMVQVYSEEIAAFYDTRTKTMHMIEEPADKKAKGPSLLERLLLGKTGGFDKEENRSVLAHELTHALADQNFDIGALQDAIEDDDDRSMALSSLIEGEAMLTMIGAQMDDWSGEAIRLLPSEDLARTFRLLGPLLPTFGGKSLRDAPPVIRESMLFPYLNGMVFAAAVTNADGWDGLNAAYKRPPLSTEQILHPAKYLKDPDPPTAIDLGSLDAGEEWKEVGRNVVGEMQLAILLARQSGRKAAEGWDGDRYAVFEGPEGRLGLVWLTTWDTEDDAREFAESYVAFQSAKLGGRLENPEVVPDRLRRDLDDASYFVVRRGADVAVVEGFPRRIGRGLLRAAFEAGKSEMVPAAVAANETP